MRSVSKFVNSPIVVGVFSLILICLAVLSSSLFVQLFSHSSAKTEISSVTAEDTKIGPNCATLSASSSLACSREKILTVFRTEGLPAALSAVTMMANEDPHFQNYCHTITHDLGKEAYGSFHTTGKIDVTDALSDCNYGFYHAFIEEMLTRSGSPAEAKAFCEFVGKELPDKIAAVSNCYHGIGHGLSSEPAELSDPVKMVEPGLAICKNISDDINYRNSCVLGVFNSVGLLYDDPRYNLPMPPNPYTLCANDVFTDYEKTACYSQMSSVAQMTGRDKYGARDISVTFSFISAIPEQYRSYAASRAALFANASETVYDPYDIIKTCREDLPGYVDSCITGVAMGLVVNGKPGDEYANAIAFYRGDALSDREKAIFLDMILTTDVYNDADQQNLCKKFPADMRTNPPCHE